MNSGGSGVKPAAAVIDRTRADQLVIGPDAFTAQDTFAQIPDDERIDLFVGLEIRHPVKACFGYPQFGRDFSKLTPVAFVADDAGFGVLGHHQPDDVFAVINYPFAFGQHGHAFRNRRNTGCQKATGFFVFDQAYPAGTIRFEFRVTAQRGDADPAIFGRRQNCRIGSAYDLPAVNSEGYGFQKTCSF